MKKLVTHKNLLALMLFYFGILSISQAQSTDPYYSYQYYLEQSNDVDLDIQGAWALTKGSNTIKVAIIDKGIQKNHEDFSNATILNGFSISGGNGNQFTSGDNHGQGVTGIIAAAHNNKGISGIAPNVEILPITIYEECSGNTSSFYACVKDAINWAVDQGADVINISQVFSPSAPCNPNVVIRSAVNPALQRALDIGRGGKGCVIVAGAGNKGDDCLSYPASYPGVISVGSIAPNGTHPTYSHTSSELDFVAPSSPGTPGNYVSQGNVYTLDFMGEGNRSANYRSNFGGTSAATPMVSGIAALILSLAPDLRYEEVHQLLKETATDIAPAGRDNLFGHGLVNAQRAVEEAYNYARCNTTISVFPHIESFESSNHSWNQHGFDDIDWTRQNGQTPTNYTGPYNAKNGNYYLYTEANNNHLKVARLSSSCYDFSNLISSAKKISFSYHMYGGQMGGLGLKLSTDGGISWITIWGEAQHQGVSWRTETIDLSGYSSDQMKFQFIGVTGNGDRSDMAIDNIVVGNPAIPDVYLTNPGVNTNPVTAGQTIQVYVRQHIQLPSWPAVSCRVKYWYSHDPYLSTTSDNVYLGQDYSSIGGGDSNDFEGGWFTIPGSASNGTRYIIIEGDANDVVPESNEHNEVVIPIEVTGSNSLPDVFTSNETLSDYSTFVGQNIRVTIRQNMSPPSAASVSSRVEYYASTDANWSNDDIFLGSDYSSIGGGDAYDSESLNFNVPNLPNGTRYIIIVCDAFNAVTESNESNVRIISFNVSGNNFAKGNGFDKKENKTDQPQATYRNTSEKTAAQAAQLAVFPNPVSDVLNVQFQKLANENRPCLLQITDINGKQLMQLEVQPNEGDIQQISTMDLIPGIYILTSIQEDSLSSVKFHVLR